MSTPPDKPSRFEEHMVTLTYTSSAREAQELAARLRSHGIVALANAEPDRHGGSHEAVYHPCVAVVSPDLERAEALLAAEAPAEGTASIEEIEAELQQEHFEELEPSPVTRTFGSVGRYFFLLVVVLLVTAIAAEIIRSLR